MRNTSLASLTLVVGLLSLCGSMYAHHGSAAYDDSKASSLPFPPVVDFDGNHRIVCLGLS